QPADGVFDSVLCDHHASYGELLQWFCSSVLPVEGIQVSHGEAKVGPRQVDKTCPKVLIDATVDAERKRCTGKFFIVRDGGTQLSRDAGQAGVVVDVEVRRAIRQVVILIVGTGGGVDGC